MSQPVTKTRILLNLSIPELAEKFAAIPVDGVGLMRAEFLALSLGIHPQKLIADDGAEAFITFFSSQLAKVVRAFFPRPVTYRTLDLKSNEYAGLKGGEFEQQEENPMLGFRGCSRYIEDAESFCLELRAVKRVIDSGLDNIQLMLPFVRFPSELENCRQLITDEGLFENPTFELWMIAEISSNVLLIEQFLPHVSGVSIGSNDLTQLILGIDRDSHKMAEQFDTQAPAVLAAIEHIAQACLEHDVPVSICGDAPSRQPELIRKLIEFGPSSISVATDAFETTRAAVIRAETDLGMIPSSANRTMDS